MDNHALALTNSPRSETFSQEMRRIGMWVVSLERGGVFCWDRPGLPVRVFATPDHAGQLGQVDIEVTDDDGEPLWDCQKELPLSGESLKERAEAYLVLMTSVLAETEDRLATLRRAGGRPLAEALPVELVAAIRCRMAHRPRDAEDFLTWSSSSGVGVDCVLVAGATQRFLAALGDAGTNGAIDTTSIWDAAAHQCLINAFS